MNPYLTLDQWRKRTMMPPVVVDGLEVKRPGFILQRLTGITSKINARLWKRYAVPFDGTVPEIVLIWLTDIVTADAYKAIGFNPSSDEDKTIIDDAVNAETEIKEAADSEKGLFDLPLREGAADAASGVVNGGPLGYSEAGPYEWTTLQREAVNGR